MRVTMRLSKQQSAEPTSLVGVPKTCPRTDCPNPTRGVEWRGSPKQLQYHCIGCWRKFDHGGVVRSWAKQVTPPACWLRGLPEHERSKPKLPKRPRRSVSPVSPVPAAPQVHGRAMGLSAKLGSFVGAKFRCHLRLRFVEPTNRVCRDHAWCHSLDLDNNWCST